jgi:membrane protease YdiL (CAAX protease family)
MMVPISLGGWTSLDCRADARRHLGTVGRVTDDNAPTAVDIPPRLLRTAPRSVRWGLSDVGLALLALLGAVVVNSVLAATGLATELSSFALAMLGYGLIVLVIVRATYRKGRRSLREDFGVAIRPIDLLIGLGAGIGLRVLSYVFVLLAVAITGHAPTEGNYVLSGDIVWALLSGILLASIVAPIVEELLMRGLLLQSVRNIVLRWRNREQPAEPAQQRRAIWISTIVSAIIFALLHAYQSTDAALGIALGLSTFTVGLVNALLVFATGRLGAGIVTHIVFNGSAIAIALLASGLGIAA